ncbi:MAG: hypothetical protein P8Q23_05260, partial [Paracoccaceae bacterium]|nr:hypothetical protein [Paracoccaceae bacterium]
MKNRIADFEVEYEHAGDLGLPRVVLGPRSYIADRIVPDFEVSIIPARKRETATAVMKARIQPTATQSFQGKKQKLLNIVKSATRTPDNAFAFDLRPYNLGNWSSAMNMCFPIACQVVAETNARDMPEPIFITNENWNPKLKSFFEAMGLKILETNSVVIAPQVTFEVGDSVLSNVLVQSFLHDRLHQIETHVMRNSEHLADKIFLDRRSSRTIQNGDEIRSLLE